MVAVRGQCGGGVLTVPALIYLLGFSPVGATTATLVIFTFASVTALVAHARDGRVPGCTGLLFAAAGIGPAMLGGALAARIPAAAPTAAFSAAAGAAALRMLRTRPLTDNVVPVQPGRAAATGAGLGAVTCVLGVGEGFLAVPALGGVLGVRMRDAVGAGLLVVTVNSPAAPATRAGTAARMDWAVVGPFVGAAILGAWDGNRMAGRISGPTLQRIFAVLLLAAAALMLTDAML
ncbi:sulfite exporter TauE/SafE family protein [Streptomyces sp. Lzd4kr]|nr:sulfite exporter TauE/SafE family protein [Streptomyces sp. Lzd4kr]